MKGLSADSPLSRAAHVNGTALSHADPARRRRDGLLGAAVAAASAGALVEAGLAAREAEKRRFFELVERLRVTADPDEVQQIKQDLARMTFGA